MSCKGFQGKISNPRLILIRCAFSNVIKSLYNINVALAAYFILISLRKSIRFFLRPLLYRNTLVAVCSAYLMDCGYIETQRNVLCPEMVNTDMDSIWSAVHQVYPELLFPSFQLLFA
jgi:hypothetical protein